MYRSTMAVIVAGLAASAGANAQPYDPSAPIPYSQGQYQAQAPYSPPAYQQGAPQYPYAPPAGAPGSPYAAPQYPPQPYAAPAYPPGYAVPVAPAVVPGQPYLGPDGLTYVNGVPVYYDDGSYYPLAFVAELGWGDYGFGNRWYGAPEPLLVQLNRFYPGGHGFRSGFRGGEGRGGEFRGGEFRGGESRGGDFHGGEHHGGGFDRR